MRTIVLIAVISALCFGASKATKPYTFTAGTSAKSSEVNSNYDSIFTPFNKLIDTMNYSIPRFRAQIMKDSTFAYLKVDTIKGTRYIDSAKGLRLTYDSLIGSARGNFTGIGTSTFDSVAVARQLKSAGINSSGPISATNGAFTGSVSCTTLTMTKADTGQIQKFISTSTTQGVPYRLSLSLKSPGQGTQKDFLDMQLNKTSGNGTFYKLLFRDDGNDSMRTIMKSALGNGSAFTTNIYGSTVTVSDSLQIGSGQKIWRYMSGAVPCTLVAGWSHASDSVLSTQNASVRIVNDVVTIDFSLAVGASTSTDKLGIFMGKLNGVSLYLSTGLINIPIWWARDGSTCNGCICNAVVSTNIVYICKGYDQNWETNPTNSTWRPFSMTYVLK